MIMKYWWVIVVVFVLVFCFKFFLVENITGNSVSSGIVTLTKVGSAGIQMSDDVVSFGSGYVNHSCEYATINSNQSNSCWMNVTEFLSAEDYHSIVNNGSSLLNITAGLSGYSSAEGFFCGGSCSYTNNAAIGVYSLNVEAGSCSGLSNYVENIAEYNSISTIGVCDYLDFADGSDNIKVYVKLDVPKDSAIGNKSFLINYEATAY